MHMLTEYIQQIELESELMPMQFPTLRIQQLKPFGCEELRICHL